MKASTISKDHTAQVIKELEEALNGGHAHASFEDAVKDVPHHLLGTVPNELPYSIWQLTEHLRIAQWDILEFSREPNHKSPPWPEGYWSKQKAPDGAGDWTKTLNQVKADRTAFVGLLHQAGEGIYHPFPYGQGQSLHREALLLIDHNSYHLGEIILLRRLLKNWQ